MSENFTDPEERILDYAEKRKPKTFSVQQVAEEVNIPFGTAQSIVSRFEDMELLQRVKAHGEQLFVYEPTKNGLELRKARQMSSLRETVQERRERKLKREQAYAASRNS